MEAQIKAKALQVSKTALGVILSLYSTEAFHGIKLS